ncbi:MAG TPA: hypothetical protein VEP91_09035 [Solirubrobacterales bacterium]|nr:hypothetical protein [Solirubrobacterales bacterium]
MTNTRIVSGPSGTVATDSVTFAFTSPEDGGFQCRLDGGEWSACESPQSYDELADGHHVFEVRALNKAGHPDPTPSARSFTVETVEPEPEPEPPAVVVPQPIAIASGPPQPVAGQSFNVEPASGTVELQCPGEDEYSRLTSFKQVPMGCLVNTRHGTIALTSSKGSSGELQDAIFWGGVFVVTQQEGDNQTVELKLAGKRMCEKRSGTARKPVARASGKRRGGRRAWGSGKGNYETSGSYGSATVRGTTWLVVDRCDASTLFKVSEGTVWVDDFVKDKEVVLEAGEQYIAKAAIPRLNPNKFP